MTIILPLLLFYHFCLVIGIALSLNNNVRFAENSFQELCNILTDPNILRLQRKNVSLVPIDAINTIATVPSQEDRNGTTKDFLNGLEKILLWTTS